MTDDGKVISGILVSKTDEQVVLKDAEAIVHTLNVADLDRLQEATHLADARRPAKAAHGPGPGRRGGVSDDAQEALGRWGHTGRGWRRFANSRFRSAGRAGDNTQPEQSHAQPDAAVLRWPPALTTAAERPRCCDSAAVPRHHGGRLGRWAVAVGRGPCCRGRRCDGACRSHPGGRDRGRQPGRAAPAAIARVGPDRGLVGLQSAPGRSLQGQSQRRLARLSGLSQAAGSQGYRRRDRGDRRIPARATRIHACQAGKTSTPRSRSRCTSARAGPWSMPSAGTAACCRSARSSARWP